ncbi:MAG: ComF family protein [Chitinophagaceae bacterium]|nr:MAG: ComF family protein [Chitinophagaceae bacterium]
MTSLITSFTDTLLHLFFPCICVGCGRELPQGHPGLCSGCTIALDETGFSGVPGNLAEKKFWGRLALFSATAGYYFRSGGLVQDLMHRLKYRSDRDLGVQLGRMLGWELEKCDRFRADLLVPLPLFPEREHKRGYNQATLLCEGMAEVLGIPLASRALSRTTHTLTQTSMNRTERWINMEGHFRVEEPGRLQGKHILLVDDVVTTGATLEACGQEILRLPDTKLSIATLCYAGRL